MPRHEESKIERAARLTRKVRKPIARPTLVMRTKKDRDERRRLRKRELLDEE